MKTRLHQDLRDEWTELYFQHAPRVRAILIKLCRSRDVDDLVQESFVKIWQGIRGQRAGDARRAWIARVVVNTAIDHFRRRAARPSAEAYDDERAHAHERGPVDASSGAALRSLARLTPEHREVLILYVMEEYSVQEVATLLRIAPGTVKSRLHYARAKLRQAIRKSA